MKSTHRQSFDEVFPGFHKIGTFEAGQFSWTDAWRGRRGVYVWAHRDSGSLTPRRVGIACGTSGVGGRHILHNRWLAGRFKPQDIREQAVRRFTLEGLGAYAELWAIEIPEREDAAAFERRFRAAYEPCLNVDLSVRSSWIKKRMNEWRAAERAD